MSRASDRFSGNRRGQRSWLGSQTRSEEPHGDFLAYRPGPRSRPPVELALTLELEPGSPTALMRTLAPLHRRCCRIIISIAQTSTGATVWHCASRHLRPTRTAGRRGGKAGPIGRHAGLMAGVANINGVREGLVALETECVDRISLNAYVPLFAGAGAGRAVHVRAPGASQSRRGRCSRGSGTASALRYAGSSKRTDPGRVWLNGHEWVKRQAVWIGLPFTPLENGFASCRQPERLRALFDSFAAEHVQAFFDRWIEQIPTPRGSDDRAAGHWWELSMRQVEISRTLVLDDPRRARSSFEAQVADNIGIDRPEKVSMVFVHGRGRPTKQPHRGRIFTTGTEVRIDFRYKHSRVKQYIKQGRALRIETVINNPGDLGVARRLHNLPHLIDKARAVNQRLLMIERAGQSCAIGSALFERIHLPYHHEGQLTELCASGIHAPWL